MPNSGRRATIRDVAKLAGVGTMTVSRVVNQVSYVSEATRERVHRAIEELGYMPNQHARGLRSRRSGTIALIVSDITNPFFTTVARGAEDAARAAGALVLVGNTDEIEAEEAHYLRLLVQKGVDGVLLVPAHDGHEAVAMAERNGLPIVFVDRRGPTGTDSIRCDSEQGAFDLGSHLVDLGHNCFGILAGPDAVSTSDDRIAGFMRALDGRRCSLRHGPLTVDSGAAMALDALREDPRPTALFAVNNFLAIGALNALAQAKISVPEEVSVVGFDDLPSQLVLAPFLTVAFQPAYDLGRLAAERLLRRIAEPDLDAEEVVLGTTLLVRGSSGSAP